MAMLRGSDVSQLQGWGQAEANLGERRGVTKQMSCSCSWSTATRTDPDSSFPTLRSTRRKVLVHTLPKSDQNKNEWNDEAPDARLPVRRSAGAARSEAAEADHRIHLRRVFPASLSISEDQPEVSAASHEVQQLVSLQPAGSFGTASWIGAISLGVALFFALPGVAAAKSHKGAAPPPLTPIVGRNDVSQAPSSAGKAANSSSKEDAKSPVSLEDLEKMEEEERTKQEEIETKLQKYLDKYPDDMDALRAMLRLRMKEGDFAEGIKILDRLIKLDPSDIDWKYLRAQMLEFSGDIQKARQGFEDVLREQPFSARALQGLASIMRKSGEDSLVLGMVEAAVGAAEQQKKAAEAINLKLLLGQLHALQGNPAAAIEQYDAIISEDSQDFRPYLCKGLVFSLMGEAEKADEQFLEFKRRCPQEFSGYLDNVLVQSSVEANRQEMEKKQANMKKSDRGFAAMKQPTGAAPQK